MNTIRERSRSPAATRPPRSKILNALWSIRSVEDVKTEINDSLRFAKDGARLLRDLERNVTMVQQGLRDVQRMYEKKPEAPLQRWMDLRCDCGAHVRWSLGDTACHNGHHHNVEVVQCVHCETEWVLETMNRWTAQSRGCWHPYWSHHCVNKDCVCGEDGNKYRGGKFTSSGLVLQ